ncbi:thiamine-phosphate kinase [Thermodesulfovibrio hydrogeniphilus]
MKKNELDIIKDLRNRFQLPEKLGIGIGDDTAVLSLKKQALLTTDLMIEGVHFDLSYTSFYHLGFKIVSVNVSDIYAMGGKFLGFLFSVGVPEKISESDFNELFEGIDKALRYYDGFLLGGDLSKSEKVVLSGFAVGETDIPILRKGAEEGDTIYITAPTGLSSAGLHFLMNLSDEEKSEVRSIKNFSDFEKYSNIFGESFSELLERHLMPRARNSDKFKRIAKAMIDISDGLLIDLFRLCEESEVGAEIDLQKIPIHPAVQKIADYLNVKALQFVLSGGEDYELIVISDKDASEFGLIPIGRIINERGIYLIDPAHGRIPAKPEGWQHFKS